MKKQIRFTESDKTYCFEILDKSGSFEISKQDLSFSSKQFYECFFKGLEGIPKYELIGPCENLSPQASHIYTTVEKILKDTCNKLDASWFEANKQSVTQDKVSEESKN